MHRLPTRDRRYSAMISSPPPAARVPTRRLPRHGSARGSRWPAASALTRSAAPLTNGLRGAGVGTDNVLSVDRPTGTALITIDAEGSNTIVVISGANAACDTAQVERALANIGIRASVAAERDPCRGDRARDPRRTRSRLVRHPEPGAGACAGEGTSAAHRHHRAERVGSHRDHRVGRVGPCEGAGRGASSGVSGCAQRADHAGRRRRDLLRSARCLHCPAVPVQAVDTTAAGDAYLGALGAALATGRGLPESLGFAAAAAALSVTRFGAQPSLASRAELDDFIARHGTPTPEALPR